MDLVKFVDTDPLLYESQLILAYENITQRTLNPADPERLMINLLTYVLTVISINIDYAGRMNLISTAQNDYLDKLGELFGCIRLPTQKSKTTIRFFVSSTLSFDVTIPQNTRVATDNDNYFYTLYEAKILAGNLYTDVQAEFFQAGSLGNNFAIGQVNKLIDVIPYISSVHNITMSMYGTDIEDDQRYRERIKMSLNSFSTAGPKSSYIYHTKSAHQDISDVSVWSNIPGQVNISFLLKNGQIPDNTMLTLVSSYLNDDKIRPLTDTVIIQAPNVINYNINLTYYIEKDFLPTQSNIHSQVNHKINDFVSWTKKLGRDILPEKLTDFIMSIYGIHSLDILSPSKTSVENYQVAFPQNISYSYGGVKE
ncbi:MAG: baseplate J/gp47 family protein [Candidatus Dojkabacteria bacterium]|nr:baseplate J/gp47 family protein [Candidatus Dojkabacteria bacterium]